MIWEPMAEGVPPVNADRVTSPVETACPICLISDPGGATHLTIPPNPLYDKDNIPPFCARVGGVVVEVNIIEDKVVVP